MNLALRRLGNKELFENLQNYLFLCAFEGRFEEKAEAVLLVEHFTQLRDPSFWKVRIARWDILRKLYHYLSTGNFLGARRILTYHQGQPKFHLHSYYGWRKLRDSLKPLFRVVKERQNKPRPKRWLGVGHNDRTSPPRPETKELPSWEEVATSSQMRRLYEKDEFLKEFLEKFENLSRIQTFIEFVL